MRLIEVKVLVNADFIPGTFTQSDICNFIETMLKRPDVIHISKTIIEGGDDEG